MEERPPCPLSSWLLAGLGNPGERYAGTRHDLGFALMDRMAAKAGLEFEQEGHAAVAGPSEWRGKTEAERGTALLVKPMSFMNRSGGPLAQLLTERRMEPSQLLVACDDVNLPLGTLRLRSRGSSGGHNGLKSIAGVLGEDYPRLRMGVGSVRAGEDLAGFVLGKFCDDEWECVSDMMMRAEAMLVSVLTEGLRPSTSLPLLVDEND